MNRESTLKDIQKFIQNGGLLSFKIKQITSVYGGFLKELINSEANETDNETKDKIDPEIKEFYKFASNLESNAVELIKNIETKNELSATLEAVTKVSNADIFRIILSNFTSTEIKNTLANIISLNGLQGLDKNNLDFIKFIENEKSFLRKLEKINILGEKTIDGIVHSDIVPEKIRTEIKKIRALNERTIKLKDCLQQKKEINSEKLELHLIPREVMRSICVDNVDLENQWRIAILGKFEKTKIKQIEELISDRMKSFFYDKKGNLSPSREKILGEIESNNIKSFDEHMNIVLECVRDENNTSNPIFFRIQGINLAITKNTSARRAKIFLECILKMGICDEVDYGILKQELELK